MVHGSTSATVASPPVSDLSSFCCLPDEPRKMRGLSMVPRHPRDRQTGGMEIYRTPDDRFADLPDFPWPPSYAEVADPDGGTLRMAYVDAGPADGPVALLLHGEPSWSFLYRHVIAVLDRARDPVRGAGPGRLRPLRQAAGRRPTTRSRGTSSGCASWPSTTSTCAR